MNRTRAALVLTVLAATIVAPGALAANADAPPTINVGGQVVGLALSPDGKILYAAKPTDSTIHVYDTATRKELASIPVSGTIGGHRVCNLTTHKCTVVGGTDLGSNPFEIALGLGGGTLYVGNISGAGTGRRVVEISSNTFAVVGAVQVRSAPTSIAIDPANTFVYVTTGKACTVDSFGIYISGTVTGNAPFSIPVTGGNGATCNLVGVAATREGSNLAVLDSGNRYTTTLQSTPPFNEVGSVASGSTPTGVTATSDANTVLESFTNSGNFPLWSENLLNPSSGLGALVTGSVNRIFAGTGTTGYATTSSNELDVIDIPTMKVLKTFPAGDDPHHVVVSPDGRTAYVANQSDGTITIIDLTGSTGSGSGSGTSGSGSSPGGPTSSGGAGSGTVTASTPTPTDVASATPAPSAVALDAASTTHGISPLLWVVIGLGVLLLAGIGVLIYVLARPKPTA